MSRRILGNFISVVFSLVKFSLMKVFHGASFRFNIVERFSPNVVTEFNNGSKVRLGERVRAHSGTIIKARKGAVLTIDDGVKINYNCIIVCRKEISIGSGTEFGPSVYLFDHDHDFRSDLKKGEMTEDSIVIGKNCWIGANTVILKGTVIGDNSVIGAGSVIKGVFPANSVVIQKRNTIIREYELKKD